MIPKREHYIISNRPLMGKNQKMCLCAVKRTAAGRVFPFILRQGAREREGRARTSSPSRILPYTWHAGFGRITGMRIRFLAYGAVLASCVAGPLAAGAYETDAMKPIPGLWADPDGKEWLFYAQLYGKGIVNKAGPMEHTSERNR